MFCRYHCPYPFVGENIFQFSYPEMFPLDREESIFVKTQRFPSSLMTETETFYITIDIIANSMNHITKNQVNAINNKVSKTLYKCI